MSDSLPAPISPSITDRLEIHLNKYACRGEDVYGSREFIAPQAVDKFNWTIDKIRNVLLTEPGPAYDGLPEASVYTIEMKYKKVFSILVSISRPSTISWFTYAHLDDASLPFTKMPDSWQSDATKSRLFRMFQRKQWRFCPLIFESPRQYSRAELDADQVLPILSKEPLVPDAHNEDHDVVLYKVKLHPHSRGVLPVSHWTRRRACATADSCNGAILK